MPLGTGLFMGCSESGLGGVEYDAVMLLRGGLATVGEVKGWIELDSGGRQARLREPRKGQKLGGFLEVNQQYCGRGGETYGSRVEVSEVDVAIWMMLQRLAAGKGESSESVEKLTELMRVLQGVDEGKGI